MCEELRSFLEGIGPNSEEETRKELEKIDQLKRDEVGEALKQFTLITTGFSEAKKTADFLDFEQFCERLEKGSKQKGQGTTKKNKPEGDSWDNEALLIAVIKEMLKDDYDPPQNNIAGIQFHLAVLLLYYSLPGLSINIAVDSRIDLARSKALAAAATYCIAIPATMGIVGKTRKRTDASTKQHAKNKSDRKKIVLSLYKKLRNGGMSLSAKAEKITKALPDDKKLCQ